MRCLKNHFGTTAEIDFVTKSAYKEVVDSNPYLNNVYTFEKNLDEILPALKARNYDQVIDLHKNIRSDSLKRKLGVPSTTFPKLNKEKWVLVNFKRNLLPQRHVVDRYFDAVKKLGVTNDGKGLDYFIPAAEDSWPQIIPLTFQGEYIAIAIGAAHFTKRCPPEIIRGLCKGINTGVILLGGPEDHSSGEEIAAGIEGRVFNACGKLSIHGSAGIIKGASKVVSNDTGMMHIAAAFSKDIISLWGNTVPDFGMYPYLPVGAGSSVIIENKNLSCRPCSKIGYAACPKGHFKCMKELDTDLLLRSVLK